MYQEKMDIILLINKYLIHCKMKSPNSTKTKNVQKYLTQKIEETLQDNISNYSKLETWTT